MNSLIGLILTYEGFNSTVHIISCLCDIESSQMNLKIKQKSRKSDQKKFCVGIFARYITRQWFVCKYIII